jgi:F-type H+-transporting ATPase subunit delta
MAAGTVAGVYAQALLELADQRGSRTAVVENCRELADGLGPAVIAQLNDPRLGKAKAKDALRAAFAGKLEREVLDLLLLLVDRNRLGDAPAIAAEAVRTAEREVGLVRVQLTTAEPLSAAAQERITSSLKRQLGPGALIGSATDPALIGGLTMRIGDVFVDGSVRRQLAEMKAKILNAPLGNSLWAEA